MDDLMLLLMLRKRETKEFIYKISEKMLSHYDIN